MLASPIKDDPARETTTRVIHVLVLDSNAADVEYVSYRLRQMGSWSVRVTGCESLEEALKVVQGEDFELIYIDNWFGATTGLAALKELRLVEVHIPAILMTDSQSPDVFAEALQAGVVGSIPKRSLSPAALQRATHDAIEKADSSRAMRQEKSALLETVKCLERRQKELESFYHNVSHELKTPLTAAREFVSLIIDGAFGPVALGQSELLEATLRNCDQMVVCVNDMLDATRLDTGKLSLKAEDMDIRAVLDDAAMSSEPHASSKGIKVLVEAPLHPVSLFIDRHRIYQVLSNLIGNAIKFSFDGGSIRIVVDDSKPNSVEIRVIDHGCGLEPNDEERVFDRFYQSRVEDAATLGGLGMGLYICREIIDLHNGRIFASSEGELGSTFTFQLPRCTKRPLPKVKSSALAGKE